MKVKKDDSKNKKKNKLQQVVNPGIKKTKKTEKVKVEPNTEVGESIKKELTTLAGNQSTSKCPLRQERWNSYLKVFLLHEKLNKKQRLIVEFCTTKGVTAPRRKAKFLNFVRSCYCHQADVSDELVNELFDNILQKYPEFKLGKYHNSDPNEPVQLPPKIGVNKKKKLKRLAEAKANSSPKKSPTKIKVEKEDGEEKWTKVKSKKRKPKTPNKVESNADMETDNQT
ncbi:uncharacterized protein LOC135845053 isoform X2 [Planococcus citri]|uniref:uncharacterized protein LOC135845053 isoform X2 n=1 Tax=Planococcus citri TaxID=170843 RepID=UPI0031F84D0A